MIMVMFDKRNSEIVSMVNTDIAFDPYTVPCTVPNWAEKDINIGFEIWCDGETVYSSVW